MKAKTYPTKGDAHYKVSSTPLPPLATPSRSVATDSLSSVPPPHRLSVQITTVLVFPPSAGRKILHSQSRPIARDAANRTDEEEARRAVPSAAAWYRGRHGISPVISEPTAVAAPRELRVSVRHKLLRSKATALALLTIPEYELPKRGTRENTHTHTQAKTAPESEPNDANRSPANKQTHTQTNKQRKKRPNQRTGNSPLHRQGPMLGGHEFSPGADVAEYVAGARADSIRCPLPLRHCLSCCGQTCECFDKMLTTRTSASSDLRMLPPSRSLWAAAWAEARVPREAHVRMGECMRTHTRVACCCGGTTPAPPRPAPPRPARHTAAACECAPVARRHVCAHTAIRLFGFAGNMCASATVRRRPTCVPRYAQASSGVGWGGGCGSQYCTFLRASSFRR